MTKVSENEMRNVNGGTYWYYYNAKKVNCDCFSTSKSLMVAHKLLGVCGGDPGTIKHTDNYSYLVSIGKTHWLSNPWN